MVDISTDITSLSDFQRNTSEHIARLKKTKQPKVLTVNGSPAVVVQDVKSYQEMLNKLEEIATVESIKAGMASHERGEGVPAKQALQDIARKLGVALK